MEIIRDEVNYDGTVVALGNFDGLHVAHMTIIRNGIRYAKENGLKSGVLLFDENTKEVTQGKIELITTNELKLELLERERADFVFMRKFDMEFMQKTPEEFAIYLVDALRVKAVCVGYDYSFGHKAQGDVNMLQSLGEKYGFKVLVTDAIKVDNRIVSSTYIRQAIKDGSVDEAERYLDRRYCIDGEVVKGFQNGRKMGIPTANVDYDINMALPKEGVYAGVAYVDGRRFKSVINVGKNLTFNARKLTVEVHILGFDEDIYGKYIRVSFAKRLRGVIKFDSIDELKKQIHNDMETALNMDL
ncbi:MAG: bifunctional riboflavin kinase/FAD synthetase [Oscillospiraceae bacterium]|nr:bifunctional riboflavin kinase/FAD synthetase [Oscillospiraceae bacterium]